MWYLKAILKSVFKTELQRNDPNVLTTDKWNEIRWINLSRFWTNSFLCSYEDESFPQKVRNNLLIEIGVVNKSSMWLLGLSLSVVVITV